MKRFEAEPRATHPTDFLDWYQEVGMLADAEGKEAMVGIVMRYAPLECFRALASDQPLWAALLARGRYADARRYSLGIVAGRGGGGAGLDEPW